MRFSQAIRHFERRTGYLVACMGVLAIAAAIMAPRNASATPESSVLDGSSQAEQGGDVVIGNTPVLIVEGQVDRFEIPISSAVLPGFYFQSALIDAVPLGDNAGAIGITLVKERNAFLMVRRRKLAKGEVVNVRAEAVGYHVFFQVGNQQPGTKIPPAYMVRHRSEQDALNALVASRTEAAMAETTATLEGNAQARAAKEAEDLVIKHLKQQDNLLPVSGRVKRSDGDTRLDVPGATWMASRLFAVVDIDHQASQPFLPKTVLVESEDGKKYDADLVDIGPYGTPNEEHLGSIPGNRKARAIIRINDATDSHFAGMRITFKQANGLPTAWVAVQEWEHSNPFMRPKSTEQVEIERRDREARGRVSIHVQAVGGVVWLSESLGSDVLDATELRGLGIRAAYGFNRYVMLDAELSGAISGESRFSSVSFAGMEGELRRTTTIGRLYLGGQVSVGHRVVPYVRLGLILQGASHDSEFTPIGGNAMRGPEAPFAFTRWFLFGGGVDVSLGQHMVGGLTISGAGPVGGDTDFVRRSLEFGLRLGYSWKP